MCVCVCVCVCVVCVYVNGVCERTMTRVHVVDRVCDETTSTVTFVNVRITKRKVDDINMSYKL